MLILLFVGEPIGLYCSLPKALVSRVDTYRRVETEKQSEAAERATQRNKFNAYTGDVEPIDYFVLGRLFHSLSERRHCRFRSGV